MPKNEQKKLRNRIFVDYKPAELKINADWLIVYYFKDPATNSFKRFRNRVPPISPERERLKYAKKMISSINSKLENGWSPFFEDILVAGYKTFEYCTEFYIKVQKKELSENVIREDTFRTNNTILKGFKKFINERHSHIKFIIEIDRKIIYSYLDYIYFEKGVKPVTYNNYLSKISSFFNFCKDKGYITNNVSEGIKKKALTEKERVVLTEEVKEIIRDKLRFDDFHYYVLCMCTYYMLIRRTELTKIKVSDVDLSKGVITVQTFVSKNKKKAFVTIPDVFLSDLTTHIGNAEPTDYLFTVDKFKTGKKQLYPNRITARWGEIRTKYKIESKYQYYSLKDTGITDLFEIGIPAIKVRNQARHGDLKMTEKYTSRNKFADDAIKKLDFKF